MKNQSREITRVSRSKQEAQTWYDTLSPWYRVTVDPFERKFRTAGLEMLHAETGERIVDVGCGNGSGLVSIAQSVSDSGQAIGIDISKGMCHVTRGMVSDASSAGQAAIVCGDALNLPFQNDSFDAVFMSFTLESFDTPDIPVVLDECKRALSQGGRICVVSLSKRNAGTVTALYERIHNVFPRYVDCRPIYLRQVLRKGDMEIIDAEDRMMWGLPVEIVLARV